MKTDILTKRLYKNIRRPWLASGETCGRSEPPLHRPKKTRFSVTAVSLGGTKSRRKSRRKGSRDVVIPVNNCVFVAHISVWAKLKVLDCVFLSHFLLSSSSSSAVADR